MLASHCKPITNPLCHYDLHQCEQCASHCSMAVCVVFKDLQLHHLSILHLATSHSLQRCELK